MRRVLKAIDAHFENALSCAFYIYVIAAIFVEVVSRYGLQSSVLWLEETAIYAFIWLTYISMANLAKTRSHLAFTAVRDALPPAFQLALLLLADACLLILSTIIIIFIYQPIADSILFGQQMMGANLPLWWATAAVPAGWLLVTIRVVQRAVVSIRHYRAGESLVTGVLAID